MITVGLPDDVINDLHSVLTKIFEGRKLPFTVTTRIEDVVGFVEVEINIKKIVPKT